MARSAKLFNFAGITPQVDDALLDANVAMVAEDVDLGRGDLMPLNGSPVLQAEPYLVKTIVDVGGTSRLKTLPYDTDVVFTTPAYGDLGRVAWVYEGVVRYASLNSFINGKEYILGVNRPFSAPTNITQPNGTPCDNTENCKLITSFCSTYVNEYGQESAPSNHSEAAPYDMSAFKMTFDNRDIPTSSNEKITFRRVYMTIPTQTTGEENQLGVGGEWFLVSERSINHNLNTETFQLNGLPSAVDTLPSVTWEVPPRSIDHIAMFPDTDSLVLANLNMIHISEPGQHHAFPRDRDIVISDNIVALQYFAGHMVVLTDGHPYIIGFRKNDQGAPIYTVERENEAYPCVSKRSVAVGTTGVVWASTDGVFTMNQTRFGISIKSLTNTLFHFDDWQSCKPESIRGALHNGQYFFTSDEQMVNSITGYKSHSWVLTYDKTVYDQPKNIFLHSLSVKPDVWYKSRRDKLYGAVGTQLFEWNPLNGVPVPYTYISRVLVEPGLTNYSAAKVVNDKDGELNFEIWRENNGNPVLLYSRPVNHSEPFRLPRTLLSVDHFIKLVGTSRVRRIHMADSLLALTRTDDTTMTHGNARLTQR